MLGEKSRATVLLRDRDPAAGLAGDPPLGRLHGAPGARCLARRAIVLLELANRPAQRGSLPPSAANTARRDAGVVECRLGLFATFRATPSHPTDSTPRREVTRFGARLRPVAKRNASISPNSLCSKGTRACRASTARSGEGGIRTLEAGSSPPNAL